MTLRELNLQTTSLIFVAAIAGPLSACHKTPEAAGPGEPSVSGDTIRFPANSPQVERLITAPVEEAHQNVLSLPARIVWDEDHTSRIMPPVAGRIDDILVQPGAQVQAGQPLAYLSSPDLGSAQTDAARAQADLEQAERNLRRVSELYDISGVAAKDLEQARFDEARARAEAERTRLRLKSLGAASLVDQRYAVRSPIGGIVVERNTYPGMEWRPDQPGAPLFVVSDPSYLWCWIDAPEQALGLLRPGMKLVLRASAWPQETYKAQIDYIGDALDATSRTVKVRARLRNPEHHLKGEMYVNAELSSKQQGLLDVPAKAVFLSAAGQQVFVRTGAGLYTRKTIHPVSFSDQWVSVAEGLNRGDEIVVDGELYLEKLLQDNSASGPDAAAQPAPAGR